MIQIKLFSVFGLIALWLTSSIILADDNNCGESVKCFVASRCVKTISQCRMISDNANGIMYGYKAVFQETNHCVTAGSNEVKVINHITEPKEFQLPQFQNTHEQAQNFCKEIRTEMLELTGTCR